MAVRRLQDGTWEFDSVAEAVEFERQFGHAAQSSGASPSLPARPRYEPFYRSLGAEYRRLVEILFAADRALNTNDLVKALHLRRTKFPPLLRHLRDMGNEYGLGEEFLIKRSMQVQQGDKRRTSYYELGGEAKEALRNLISESAREDAAKAVERAEAEQEGEQEDE